MKSISDEHVEQALFETIRNGMQFVKWMPNCSAALNELIRGGVNTQADLKGRRLNGSSTKRTSD